MCHCICISINDKVISYVACKDSQSRSVEAVLARDSLPGGRKSMMECDDSDDEMD